MKITCLDRHLYVCAQREVQPILDRDKTFWNIISIREPCTPPPRFRGAKDVLSLVFEDVDTDTDEGGRAVHAEDIEKAFTFVDERPSEPILLHCRFGLSRSTALALLLIARGMIERGESEVETAAVEQLLALRPHAVPNCRVLELGLSRIMPEEAARVMMVAMANHPRLAENRFIKPNRS